MRVGDQEKGNSMISIYLPLNKVANSLDSKFALELVIYISIFCGVKPVTIFIMSLSL
jgi:hypothetical protein